jgi:hypothetical protein
MRKSSHYDSLGGVFFHTNLNEICSTQESLFDANQQIELKEKG